MVWRIIGIRLRRPANSHAEAKVGRFSAAGSVDPSPPCSDLLEADVSEKVPDGMVPVGGARGNRNSRQPLPHQVTCIVERPTRVRELEYGSLTSCRWEASQG